MDPGEVQSLPGGLAREKWMLDPSRVPGQHPFFLDRNPNKPLAMQVDPKPALSPR